jgi:hypothetical protein
MRTVRTCIGSIAAASQLILQVGCTSTPSLSEITGTEQSPVFIKDVVQRIKCEITEAFDDKLRNPDFRWLSDWTAHVDLTLTINDNAGIGPNGSYQRFQNNAVNFDAGPSSFPASASRAVVNQFLTVSAGATLSGQAIRTEKLYAELGGTRALASRQR